MGANKAITHQGGEKEENFTSLLSSPLPQFQKTSTELLGFP
jgi:hypothetical protein